MPREEIPITPEVLQWARKRAQYSIDELRQDFKQIESWESGESFPTYPQIEKLSEIFRIPIAVFFFPEPPSIPAIRESFRTLPDANFEALPREIRFLLRKAKALQINISELNEGKNPAERFILQDLNFSTAIDIPEMAQRVRDYIGISFDDQMAWSDSSDAFDNWREAIEGLGIAVFKDAFKNDSYSGFCLYDQTFPLIYVNNSVKTRQIFTLFHELAHLLFHTSGIDTVENAQLENTYSDEQQIEVICNKFAAEFLLPEGRFLLDIAQLEFNEETAVFLANRYHVSREFIFRRFLERKAITSEEYVEAAQRWASQRNSGSGGNHYWTKIAYLGTNYMGLAFSKYYQNKISEPELADYLDTKVKNLSKLETYYAQKVV